MSDPNNENLLVKQQKYRAQRIDHDYHKKPHPWRRIMRILTIVLPLAGAAALAFVTFKQGNRTLYAPGPVSSRHASFNERCELCHEVQNGKFGVVSNALCSQCHDGPIHNANQVCSGMKETVEKKDMFGKSVTIEEPRCASCHTEHKGNQQLVQMSDSHCTQCHENLQVKPDLSGKPSRIAGFKIKSFEDGHPEWRVLVKDADGKQFVDTTAIKFGHELHMNPNKVSYEKDSKFGERGMQCTDCHRTSDSNLEPMQSESERLKAFEATLGLDESGLIGFYAMIATHAQSTGVVKYKLNATDVRKLAVETLADGDFYARFNPPTEKGKAPPDPAVKKALFEERVIRTIRERLGSMAAAGENRYMIPISFGKNCASACHAHGLQEVNYGDEKAYKPHHGSAEQIRAELTPLVKQWKVEKTILLGMETAKKAGASAGKGPTAEIVRKALNKEAGVEAEADKAKVKKALEDTLDDLVKKKKLYAFVNKAFADANKKDDVYSFVAPDISKKDYDGYADLKAAKEKVEWSENVAKVITDEVVNKEPGGAAPDMGAIGAQISDVLKDGMSSPEATAKMESEVNEKLKPLFTGTGKDACMGCHVPKQEGAKALLGEIKDTNIPVRWLNHASFNHETHNAVSCEQCHATARNSKTTEDVLLPGKRDCQVCHKPTEARADCIECHIYHDKTHLAPKTSGVLESLMMRSSKPK